MLATSSSWRRPWRELIKPIWLFSRPKTFREAMRRIKYNLGYFRANYIIVALFILFLSVLLQRQSFFPLFMLVLFIFYFSVDDPLQFEVWNHPIDGRLLLEVLSTLPPLALLYAGLWLNVFVWFLVSLGLIGLHANFRGSVAFLLQDQEAATAAAAA